MLHACVHGGYFKRKEIVFDKTSRILILSISLPASVYTNQTEFSAKSASLLRERFQNKLVKPDRAWFVLYNLFHAQFVVGCNVHF